jgi:hypothetical protein
MLGAAIPRRISTLRSISIQQTIQSSNPFNLGRTGAGVTLITPMLANWAASTFWPVRQMASGGSMSDQPAKLTPQEVLRAFDQAYASFLEAFNKVPDEALSFLPAGDEYALGVLLLHLQDPLRKYTALLDQMLNTSFAHIDLSEDAEQEAAQARRHQELLQRRPGPDERAPILLELDSLHHEARTRFEAIDASTFERLAPVIYSAGAAPYPTSARDMLGWLTDHYDEHTAQIEQMLAQWETQGA